MRSASGASLADVAEKKRVLLPLLREEQGGDTRGDFTPDIPLHITNGVDTGRRDGDPSDCIWLRALRLLEGIWPAFAS